MCWVLPPQEQDIAFAFAELFSSLFKSLWKSAQTSFWFVFFFFCGKLAEGALCLIIQVINKDDRRQYWSLGHPDGDWHLDGLCAADHNPAWLIILWLLSEVCLDRINLVLFFLFPPPTIIRVCKHNVATKAFWQSVKNRYHQVIRWFISSSNEAVLLWGMFRINGECCPKGL